MEQLTKADKEVLDAKVKDFADGIRDQDDLQILFESLMLKSLQIMTIDHFKNENSRSVKSVIEKIRETRKSINEINACYGNPHAKFANESLLFLDHVLFVYEHTWLSEKEDEKSIQRDIFKNIKEYIPDAIALKEEYKIGSRRCDIFAELNGEKILIEVKKGTVGKSALKQIQWYLKNSGINKGYLIGSTISNTVSLPSNIKFISYNLKNGSVVK